MKIELLKRLAPHLENIEIKENVYEFIYWKEKQSVWFISTVTRITYKSPNLEEAIELLPKSILLNWNDERFRSEEITEDFECSEELFFYNGTPTVWPYAWKTWWFAVYGDADKTEQYSEKFNINLIEKMLEYLLNNNLLWTKK